MLILSRQRGQEIVVGDNIVVRVERIGGGSVRIGVDAPAYMPILQGEEKRWQPGDPVPEANR